MEPPASLLDLTVRELLDAVAARTSAPGGGAVAALTTALAAALTGMAARYGAPEPGGAADPAPLRSVADRADALRHRAAALADADAAAYTAFLAARRLPVDDPGRAAAADAATAVPAEIADVADEVSALALGLRHRGNPNLDGDVVAAVLLAAAATTTAAGLVRENVGDRAGDPRLARAQALMAQASHRTRDLADEQTHRP